MNRQSFSAKEVLRFATFTFMLGALVATSLVVAIIRLNGN